MSKKKAKKSPETKQEQPPQPTGSFQQAASSLLLQALNMIGNGEAYAAALVVVKNDGMVFSGASVQQGKGPVALFGGLETVKMSVFQQVGMKPAPQPESEE